MRKYVLIELIVCDKCGKARRIGVKLGDAELCHECAIKEIESKEIKSEVTKNA